MRVREEVDDNNDDNNPRKIKLTPPLFLHAVASGDAGLIQKCMRINKQILHAVDRQTGKNALHIAAENNQGVILFQLLEWGLSPSVKDNKGNKPRDLAKDNGLKRLLELKEEILSTTEISSEQFRIISQLISPRKSYADNIKILNGRVLSQEQIEGLFGIYISKDPFLDAISKGELGKVKDFIRKGRSVNEVLHLFQGKTPLFIAVHAGNLKMVKFLITKKADIYASFFPRGHTAFLIALQDEKVEIVRYFLQHDKNLACSKAQFKDHIGEEEVNVSLPALHIAVKTGNLELIALLLRNKNIQIDEWAMESLTALHLAVMDGQIEVVALLLDFGATIDAKSKGGVTALGFALMQRLNEVAIFLIQRGADIKAKFANNTLLFHAIFADSLELTRAIVEKDPEQLQMLIKGEMPKDLAKKFGRNAIYCYLLGEEMKLQLEFEEQACGNNHYEVIVRESWFPSEVAQIPVKVAVNRDAHEPALVAEESESIIDVSRHSRLFPAVKTGEKATSKKAAHKKQQMRVIDNYRYKKESYTWAHGLLASDLVDNEKGSIETVHNNAFLCLFLPKAYLAQKADRELVEDLCNIRPVICMKQGLKSLRLKPPIYVNLTLGNQQYENLEIGYAGRKYENLEVCFEAKKIGTPARILCVKIPADDTGQVHRPELIIGVRLEEKGLHDGNRPPSCLDVVITNDMLPERKLSQYNEESEVGEFHERQATSQRRMW